MATAHFNLLLQKENTMMHATRGMSLQVLCGMIALAVVGSTLAGVTLESTFDGGGDGSSWADHNNWAPDITPHNVLGLDFNVTIPAGFSVIYRAQDTYTGGALGETVISDFALRDGATSLNERPGR